MINRIYEWANVDNVMLGAARTLAYMSVFALLCTVAELVALLMIQWAVVTFHLYAGMLVH